MGINSSAVRSQCLHNKPLSEMEVVEAPSGGENIMSAIIFNHHGAVDESLELVHNVSRPVPSPGQILVKVHAYGISPMDIKLLENLNAMIPLPKIIGCDFSGTVVSLADQKEEGDGCPTELRVGDKVLGVLLPLSSSWGSAAEYLAIDATLCAKVPTDSMDLIEACGVPVAGLTVYQGFQPFVQHCASINTLPPADGDARTAAMLLAEVNTHTSFMRVLILGGNGDVGTLATQYCKNVLGMYVIATAPSNDFDFVKNLGADEVINTVNPTLDDTKQPVDVIFDTLSIERDAGSCDSSVLKAGGWYLKCPMTIQEPQSPPSAVQHFLSNTHLRSLASLSGVLYQQWTKLSSYVRTLNLPFQLPRFFSSAEARAHFHLIDVRPNDEDLRDILTIMVANGVHVVVDRVFPMTLDKIKEAHKYVASGKECGKVVIRMQPGSTTAETSAHLCQAPTK